MVVVVVVAFPSWCNLNAVGALPKIIWYHIGVGRFRIQTLLTLFLMLWLQSPGSVMVTADMMWLVSLLITTSNVWQSTWVGSCTCCCRPQALIVSINRWASRSFLTSTWKFRSATIIISLLWVMYRARNVDHWSKKSGMVEQLSFDGGVPYTTVRWSREGGMI